MPTIDGAAAARTLVGYAPLSKHGYCLYYVWLAMKAHGATSGTTYPTAYSAWQATKRRHADKNPPAGATVWLGRRSSDGNMAGDVVISIGGGRVVCTDYPGWGQVGTCTIDQRIAQTGRQYLGWSEDFLGNTTVVIGQGASIPVGDVSFIQAALNLVAGSGLDVDGKLGPLTAAAVSAFQGAHGLTVDGIPGPITVAALIQALLNRTGANLVIDGKIGPASTAAVESFQRALDLGIDGIPGPITRAALLAWKPATRPTPPDSRPVGRNATSRPTEDIQRLVGVAQDGKYGADTTAAVIAWQTGQGIDADGIWGNASDGLGFPPAGSLHGIDYSFARPDPAMLARRGVKLAGRYLWAEKYADGRTNKGIGRAELDALHAQRIDVFFIYEEDGKELLGGRDAGVRVATAADAFLQGLGLAGHPIYFNVDYDAPAADMPKIIDALDGIASVIGFDRVGLYAGYGPIAAAFDAGKIRWGFQTYAWSGGRWDARAQLQQWANGQWGGSVDFTRAMVAEYGQHPVVAPEPEEPTPDPDFTSIPTPLAKQLWEWLKGIFGSGK